MRPLRTETRKLVSLAVPATLAQVGTMLLGVVDTLMAGRYSDDALAAATLGHLWTLGTMIVVLGLIFGIDPVVTQAAGRRDERALGLALQRGVWISLLASIPLGAVWLLTEPCLLLLGQEPPLASLAADYVLVQVPTLPAFLVFNVLRQYLQGRGMLRPGLWVVILANILNVGLNYVLIYGALGVPELGVVGAGLATGLTRLFLLAALAGWTLRLRLWRGGWTPWTREAWSVEGMGQILRPGFFVAVQYSLEVWAFQAATLLAGMLGQVELQAHAIALNLASLSFMFPLGISLAAVVRVGHLTGERRRRRAQLAAWISLGLGALVMLVFALVFTTLRSVLPRVYTIDEATRALAARVLPIAAVFQVFDGTQVVGGGILRGMGRARPAAIFNAVGYYAIALPLGAWLAFGAGHSIEGLWWGLCSGLASVAALLVAWIARRGPGHDAPRIGVASRSPPG